ncbi:GP63, leishmanolysin [Leishmania tarentolae]|uniref:Leishmanolysin n=1 Tax=Leishmania tarentolae TaxID=5689 RepID=A0A640KG56_LEITA|nr:GP63, leishmanolysin [Leishmania tarentolae]
MPSGGIEVILCDDFLQPLLIGSHEGGWLSLLRSFFPPCPLSRRRGKGSGLSNLTFLPYFPPPPLPVSSLDRSAIASPPATLLPTLYAHTAVHKPSPSPPHPTPPTAPRSSTAMAIESSRAHRLRSVAARLVRLAAAGAGFIVAVGTSAAWAHAGAVQHRCIHDSMQAHVLQSVAEQRSHPSSVSLLGLPYVAVDPAETAADKNQEKRSTGSAIRAKQWDTLRIAVSTEDLTDPAYHCARVGQNVSTHDDGFATCTAKDILTDEKRDILVNYLLPQALQLHTERLKVRQVQGRLRVTDMLGELCGSFKVPQAHITEGFRNTDFVLYVASVPSEPGVLSWAKVCQVFPDGRPAVGVVNIPAASITSRYSQAVARVVAHEIAHALGFRKEFFEAAGILQQVLNVRGKDFRVPVIKSSTVVAKARGQYGCNTLEYLELEDQGGEGAIGSHIKMRNAQDELMSAVVNAGYYTALTMAVFHDLGFYQADFSKAEVMPWGKDAGCAFLSEKCMENGVTKWPKMFCNEFEFFTRCPTSRLGLGTCLTGVEQTPLPPYWQYFGNSSLTGKSALMDYCPIVVPFSDGSCAQSASEASEFLNAFNVFSDAARCIDGDFRPRWTTSEGTPYAGLCANVKCNACRRTYRVQVRGSSSYVSCTPGRRVQLSSVSNAFEQGDYITCPPYVEVCQGNVQALREIVNAVAVRRPLRA